ncbi:hypothetical protein VT85_18410 [Planctomyces sp. SH-PL62]|nr:hypothetical protein VT85_18410 [Planctomyces sp. SH-PL62]
MSARAARRAACWAASLAAAAARAPARVLTVTGVGEGAGVGEVGATGVGAANVTSSATCAGAVEGAAEAVVLTPTGVVVGVVTGVVRGVVVEPAGTNSKAPTSRGPNPASLKPRVVGLTFSGMPRKSVLVAIDSRALLMAAEFDARPKSALR